VTGLGIESVATEASFVKHPNGILVPASQNDVDYLDGIKTGDVIKGKFSKVRNGMFFRKWWALVGFLYDHWEPESAPGQVKMVPQKNFDRFRKDLTIFAGFYEMFYRLNGDVKVEAKSISFGSMDELEFEQLYSKTIDVGLQRILKNYTSDDVDRVVENLLRFS